MIPRRTRAARARLYASERQRVYLRSLLREAFARHIDHGLNLDWHHLEGCTREYASTAIARLKELLRRPA